MLFKILEAFRKASCYAARTRWVYWRDMQALILTAAIPP